MALPPYRVPPLAATAAAAATGRPSMRLSNGQPIRCVSRLDVPFLYNEIYERRCYLQHGLALPPGGTVLDMGANIGLFSMFAAEQLGPEGLVIACEPLPATYECLEWNAAAHRRWLEQHQHQQQQPAPSQGDVQRSRQVERSEQPSSSTGGGVCSSSNSVGSSRTGPPAPILALPVGVGSSAGGEAIFTFYPQAAGWSSMRPSSGEVHTGMAVFLDNALASPEAARAAGLGPLASAVGVWAHRWAPAWLLGAARWAVVAALLGGARQCRCRLVSVSQLILEHRLTAVDLLKVDVERAELDVLQGVEACHWPLVRQAAVEVHESNLAPVLQILRGEAGFDEVAVEQDVTLAGGALHTVYASRRS